MEQSAAKELAGNGQLPARLVAASRFNNQCFEKTQVRTEAAARWPPCLRPRPAARSTRVAESQADARTVQVQFNAIQSLGPHNMWQRRTATGPSLSRETSVRGKAEGWATTLRILAAVGATLARQCEPVLQRGV